jgi:hypothetical protein
MEHRLEVAPSGRATCRTCNKPIAKGELRVGEEYASQFGSEGFAIRWHHPLCAAAKIPAVLQQAMASYDGDIPDREALEAAMSAGTKKAAQKGTGALPSADLAPTSRAKCLHCQEAIEKATVRIGVEREVDTGSFVTKGAGYLHPACVEAWAEEGWEDGLDDLVARVKSNTGLAALPPPFGEATAEEIAALASDDGAKPKKGKKASEGAAKSSESATKASESAAKASEGAAKPSEGATKDAEAASGAAPAEAPLPKKAPKPKAAPVDSGPAFKQLTGKQVASIVAKLAKVDADYKGDSILEKAGVDWGDRDLLRWHIASHGLLEPTHAALLHRLSESAWNASAEEVFAVVPKLDTDVKKSVALELMPGWPLPADVLLVRAAELDAARLEGMLATASPRLRRGIQLVRGRLGASLEDADRQAVLAGLAEMEAKDYGLPSWSGVNGSGICVRMPSKAGERNEPFRNTAELARHFGTEAEWIAALTDAARKAQFGSLQLVLPALVAMPLAELVALIAKPHFSSGEQHDAQMARLVELRDDDPKLLAEAALTIGREDYPGMYVREQLLVHAIARMGMRGVQVPDGLEREPKWDGFAYCVAPWRGSKVLREVYRKALEAIGRERALALVAPILERTYGHSQALPFLAVHFDEAIARRIVAGRADLGLTDPDAFAALGAPVIPIVLAALEAPADGTPEDGKRRDALVKCLRGVLGFVGASGGSFDASLDRFVSCSPEESYWREEAKVILLHTLRAMPEERRIATLDRLFAETKQVERAFLGVQTVGEAAFRQRAARIAVQRYAQVQDKNTFQGALVGLKPDGLESFRPALLEGQPDTKLFEQLRFVFGHEQVDALMKAANVVEETNLARLLRLAKAYLDAHPDAPKERLYVLERADLEPSTPPRRAGSFSASRGNGPGGLSSEGQPPTIAPGQVSSLDQVLAMKKRAQKASEDEEHILTIDLEEVPELRTRFPDARAISLFAPSPEHGDAWDRARLRPVPLTCSAPADGTPISVIGLEVPSALFDSKKTSDDPPLKELRGLVFNRPGYLLGEPMFIQDDEGSGAGFVMQLSERIGDLNLGDSGSLYVFEGDTFMQCY